MRKFCVSFKLPWKRRGETKRYYFLLVGSLFVVGLVGFLTIQLNVHRVLAWYNSSWGYRQPITVTNNTGSSQTNYQYLLRVNTALLINAGKLQSNCNDLRFTDSSNNLLSYYIDSGCNTTTTSIWVYITSLPTGNSTLYMYYGNVSAAAGSSSTNFDNLVNLIDYYTFNDGSGSSAIDSSVSGNNGTLSSATGTVSHVQNIKSITASSLTTSATFSSAVTSGDLLICAVRFSGTPPTNAVTDNVNGNWTKWTAASNAGNSNYIYYVLHSSSASGGSMTVTVNAGSSGTNRQSCDDFTGASSWTLDTASNTSSGSSTSWGSPTYNGGTSITPGASGELLYTGAGSGDSGDTITAGSSGGVSLTIGGQINTNGTIFSEYAIAAASGAQYATATSSTTDGTSFNGGIGFISYTPNTYTPTWGSGKYGNDLSFSGANAEDVSFTTALTGLSNYTIEAWVKPGNTNQDGMFFYNEYGGIGLGLNGSGGGDTTGDYLCGLYEAVSWMCTTSTLPSTSTWYHVAIQRGGGTTTIYLNGTSVGTFSSTPTYTNTGSAIGSSIGNRPFNGQVDDVKFYSNTRTSTQISNDYSTSYSIATAGVGSSGVSRSFGTEQTYQSSLDVLYWKFDDGSGTSAADSTNSGNTGTLAGGILPTWQTQDQCVYGMCLYFNGTTLSGGYVGVSGSVNNIESISFWIKPISISANDSLVNFGAYNEYISISSGNIITDGVTSPTIYVNGKQTTAVTPDIWQQVVVTTSTPISATNFNVGSITTKVVSTIATSYYQGYMDDVKLLSYVLTPVQVLSDFNGPGSLNGTSLSVGISNNNNYKVLNNNLVGYWKMDENTGSTTVDSSGNGNTGTLAGTGSTPVTGTSTGSNTSTTLNNTGASWTTNAFTNETINITGGTGSGESNTVSSNTATQITVANAWSTIPDATSTYSITMWGIGKFGSGLAFNGVNSQLTDTISMPNSMTFAVWAKPTNVSASSDIITSCGPSLSLISGSWEARQCGDNWYAASYPAIANTWQFVVGTYVYSNGTLQRKLYINGNLVSSNNTGYNYSSSFQISALSYTGFLDELRIYNRALSPADVQNLYNYSAGPVAYWSFEKSSTLGSTVLDQSGNANNGTWDGVPKYTYGSHGEAAVMDGSTTDIKDSSITTFKGAGAIEGWFNMPSSGSEQVCLGSYYIGAGELRIDLNATSIEANVPGDTNHTVTFPYNISNSWHFLAHTYGNGTITTYLDGNLIASYSYSTTPKATQFYVGDTGSHACIGSIAQPRLYNYAIAQKQIVQDMNSGASTVSRNGPLGYWKFDEGYGTTINNSGNGGSILNGTINSASWNENGHSGKALSFNGINSYLSVPYNSSLNITTPLSISAWFNTTSTSTMGIVNRYAASPFPGYGISMKPNYGCGATAGQLGFWVGDNTNQYLCSTKSYNDGKWHHVVGVYDGTTASIYVDGLLQASGARTASLSDTSDNLIIGAQPGPSNYFSGILDEVKIYSYALAPSEVLLDYNNGMGLSMSSLSTNPSDGKTASGSASALYCIPGDTSTCLPPLAEWNFNENQGTSTNDTSGNGNSATFAGSTYPTWNNAGKCVAGGNCLYYNNSGYLTVADTPQLRMLSTDFTVCSWIKPTNVSNLQGIVDKDSSSAGWGLWVYGTGRMDFWTQGGYGGTQDLLSTSGNIQANVWQYVCAVYHSSNYLVIFYVNGVFDSSGTSNQIQTTTQALNIGAMRGGGSPFTGWIANTKLYSYARSPAQIEWDYNRGRPVGWWKFDECQGTTAYDSSGNSTNGTIYPGSQTIGNCATSSTLWGNGANGKINSSFYGDGSSSYVDIPNKAYFFPSTYTLSAWVNFGSWYTGSCLGNMIIAAGSDNTSNWSYEMSVQDTGFCGSPTGNERVKFVQHFSDASTTTLYSTSYLSLNKWYLISLSYDGSNMNLYINGVLNTSTSIVKTPYLSTNDITIGKMNDSSYPFWVKGNIDDVRIYNYPLTSIQIQTLYNNGFAFFDGPASGMP